MDAQLAAPDLSEDEKQILSVKQQEVIAGMQKLQMTLQPLQTQKQSAQTQLAQGEKKLTQMCIRDRCIWAFLYRRKDAGHRF